MIIIEGVVALIMAILLGGILAIAGANYGGNYMTDFTFGGVRGYEATGMLGVIFGFPVGGILGALLARYLLPTSEQKMSSAIKLGFFVGAILFVLFFFLNKLP